MGGEETRGRKDGVMNFMETFWTGFVTWLKGFAGFIWNAAGSILENTELCYGIVMLCFAVGIILIGAVTKSMESEIEELRGELQDVIKGVKDVNKTA